jgi:uncharacterized protein YydD (DUF2326 family)
MILSKIYSNQETFKSIIFKDTINFILSEDHSVGKTTLLNIIDFCLLKGDKGFLSNEKFNDYIFYLELKISENKFITIKRPASGKSNIQLKVTESSDVLLDTTIFDITGGVSKVKSFFEEKANLSIDNFRQYITYFLRDQDNQSDVFRLNKFIRSKDIDYKPIISKLLGINGSKIRRKYELDNEIESIEKELILKESELGNYRTKEAILEEIAVYEKQLTEKEQKYKEFDFYLEEKNISKELVNKNEVEISLLNEERNSINRELEYINKSLEEEIAINMEDINGLFEEINILFPDTLKTNYENVVNFNKQIMEERIQVFKENKIEFTNQINNIESELSILNEQRKSMLSILKSTDTMDKFKEIEKEVVNFKSKIEIHRNKLNIFENIEEKKLELEAKRNELKETIIENKTLIKSDFIKEVKANLIKYGKIIFDKELAFSIGFNTADNIDFDIKVENQFGFDNSLENGHTIKKLLCFIFSASLAEAYSNKSFIKFVAFDSPFDGDKNTYQDGVFNVIKELSTKNIQTIITSVSDVISNSNNLEEIKDKYVVRHLSESDKLLGDF